jgi:hypothetical protein
MNLKTSILSATAVLMSLTGNLFAQDIVETVQQGCAAEITAYCSQVSPGEGRLLACFYAHEDKLSGQCQYALYSASAQLDAAVSALDYLATQCRDDILKFCANVQVGEGRVLECIKSNQASVSAACNQAVSDVTE